jgi:Putative prokaryotic signal transducing protein
MTRVHTAGSEVEAVMLRGVLEDAGIPVTLQPHTIPGYTAAQFPPGWGDLLVPDAHAREARRLLADYLASLGETAS